MYFWFKCLLGYYIYQKLNFITSYTCSKYTPEGDPGSFIKYLSLYIRLAIILSKFNLYCSCWGTTRQVYIVINWFLDITECILPLKSHSKTPVHIFSVVNGANVCVCVITRLNFPKIICHVSKINGATETDLFSLSLYTWCVYNWLYR